MADVFTPEQRSRVMAAVKCKDTTPEWIVRRITHAMGYRYRLHVADLPGKPDLVFPSRRKVIFVHGCFWHMHTCKRGRRMPATRREYWQKKLSGNQARDRRHRKALCDAEWDVLTIWECWTKNQDDITRRVAAFLDD